MMDTSQVTGSIFNTVVGALLAAGGWFMRILWNKVDRQNERFHEYLRKDDFIQWRTEQTRWQEAIKDDLKTGLARIEHTLDNKANK